MPRHLGSTILLLATALWRQIVPAPRRPAPSTIRVKAVDGEVCIRRDADGVVLEGMLR